MSENPNEQNSEAFTPEEELEMYEAFMAAHPDVILPPEEKREPTEEIAEFQRLVTEFEVEHPPEKLFAITDLRVVEDMRKVPLTELEEFLHSANLTEEEVQNNLIREAARKALGPILSKLNILKEETNITPDAYDELYTKYKHFSRAVGIINAGKVDHER